ncbi:Big-1 domain-containing protein [Vibrio jasicida]|uniref:Big-1 domain-containing protein n=2 Tax=Vibrio jasicida TaxID=766224 RepID=A0AAU9QFB4_9VIBR|nr:Big-1 domain-containing protein [Vibrio jasicida]CAH1601947.1 Big-1 domain-containing protein [Vibrio jasicida]
MINLTSDPALLAPKSETAQVGDTITISVGGPVLTAGYTLDSEVVVLGDGVASGDGTTDEITYEANAQGVTRLVYTMTNADGNALLMGTVDVAVSGPGNYAPEVEGASFTEQSDGSPYEMNTSYTFDLSPYVTDVDGDDIQLIQVDAWNATVELAAPNDPSNLSFTFDTSHAGVHYVTYVVSDHKGGYGVAQVRIEVYDSSGGAAWGDIQMGLKLFFGPLTTSEAQSSDIIFTSSYFDTNGANVATFNFTHAKGSCQNKGRLPTSEELKALASYNNGPDISDSWPVDLAYWANNSGTGELIDLKGGGVVSATNPGGYYVSCMNELGFFVDDAGSQLEAIANGAGKAVVAVKLTWNDEPVEGQLIEASTSNTNVTFDATTGTTDSAGLTSFALSSLVAEDVPVDITYNGETLTQNVTFVADEATASLTLAVTKDNAQYDDQAGNEVNATMVDINSNPLVGRSVTFDSDFDTSVTIIPAPGGTDATGKQKASVVWNDNSVIETSTTVNVTGRFTPQSTGTEISDTAAMTFISLPICGGVVNDSDRNNARGYCLKVATNIDGYWFTSSPSIEVMNKLGYSKSDTVNNTGDTYAASSTKDIAGVFAAFRQDGNGVAGNANGGVNGQFDRWCQKLNDLGFGGRTTWERPHIYEVESLYSSNGGNMWYKRGWPTSFLYWSRTFSGSEYRSFSLYYGGSSSGVSPSVPAYASCVSRHP